MKVIYCDREGEPRPARGDLLQTNVGDRRERTWLVLGARALAPRRIAEWGITAQRTRVWCERWWELEPSLRVALFRSAQRRDGGQRVFPFHRFRAKRRLGFEAYMRRREKA